nr:MAG TPA: hypothetical protein [Caudoviricetes sp.]
MFVSTFKDFTKNVIFFIAIIVNWVLQYLQ